MSDEGKRAEGRDDAERIAAELFERLVAQESSRKPQVDPLTLPEPLTDRLEREGKGRGARSVAFSALTIVVAAVLNVFALRNLVLALPRPVIGPGLSFSVSLGGSVSEALVLEAVALAFAGAAYLTVRRPDRQLTIRMLGAKPASAEDLALTRAALHDMCLASGLTPTPPLYVVETPAVNAVVVGLESRATAVVVTRGLATTFGRDEQRAVMAHLIARLRIRNAPSAEGMSSLEEQADALGMQALRDPRAMLSALERSRDADSRLAIRASGVFDGYAFLPMLPFGTDPGAHERRIARLRAVLGVEGAAT